MTLTDEQKAQIREANRKLVETAPPLGPIQRDRIAAAMRPVRRRLSA